MKWKSRFAISAVLLLGSQRPATAVDYARDIRPLLIEKCSPCRGAIRQEAGLRLDAGQLVHRGGDDGRVINIKSPDKSLLLERVESNDVDQRMPPEGESEPLKPRQIALLRAWIEAGAQYPTDETIPPGPASHWAYQQPLKAAPPKVSDAAWSTNPIDAFILARLERKGLRPAPAADRRTLLRRLYLDLIGLPPTPAEQRDFLNDKSRDARARVVDRLLNDPAYGQRWGRHWMDVWRYSDWDGYKQQLRGSQRHIWRWREWIVESLNADKPYDRMVKEMLAGDELAPENRDTLRATGYLARSYHNSNRTIWLDATVEHTAKAFLAMTINCARCHDHKYDPIKQKEYYALRAVFEPHDVRTERVSGEPDLKKSGLVRAYDARPNEPTYIYLGGNEKRPDKEHPVTAAAPRILGFEYDPTPIDLPPLAVFPALRDFREKEAIAAALQKVEAARRQLAELKVTTNSDSLTKIAQAIARQRVEQANAELASIQARWNADKAKFGAQVSRSDVDALAAAASQAERRAAVSRAQLAVLVGRLAVAKAEAATAKRTAKEKKAALAKAKKELTEAEKKLAAARKELAKPNQVGYSPVGKAYPARSTGRRLALAKWITDPRNPLAARVAVNHVWMRHFGQPLVENVFDFGMRTPEPTHRDLLDWLAVDLVENGWRMKRLHRLIVTSRVYQTRSHVSPEEFAANYRLDPDNRLLWKSNIRRLEAEVIRDSVLSVAGSLDRSHGGPDIEHTHGARVFRRSLYFRHAYEKQMPMLVAFDAASPSECYRRSESVVPQQALALSNGPLAVEQSRLLAGQLSQAVGNNDDFVRAAFVRVLCRECTPAELQVCKRFLESQARMLRRPEKLSHFQSKVGVHVKPSSDPSQRARENLVHVLINHNDFVTVR